MLVSAFIKPESRPARILRLVIQGEVDIVVNESILSEYLEVLTRPKFDLNPIEVRLILNTLRSKGIKAAALARSLHLPDSGDEPFLEAALATEADVIISGNKKHFPQKACQGQRVLSPAEFLNEL